MIIIPKLNSISFEDVKEAFLPANCCIFSNTHIQVCRTCNATGHNCGIAEGSKAGPGIDGADFVFYVSAMQTERCHKGLTVAYAAHCQQEAALDR